MVDVSDDEVRRVLALFDDGDTEMGIRETVEELLRRGFVRPIGSHRRPIDADDFALTRTGKAFLDAG